MVTVQRTPFDVLSSTGLLQVARRATLERLAAASTVRTLRRDQILFIAGSRSSAVYAVASGTLRVFTTSAVGAEPTLALLSAGDMVGELGVLDDVPRSTSVAALRASDVVEVPGRAFRDAFESDPAVARRLVALLSARLRTSNDGFTDLASLDLGGRLAKYLLGEVDRQGHDRLKLPLTQTELGQLLGGARQTVNQVMQALERSGLVQVTGRTVHVLDAEGLRRRAGGIL
ncbi:MAG: Crp/Fnr family transcriptional regulator [Actinobacteria bacterium]|nr:Crp/Fnr family transcriptional regulator [Actinomycetota bacterium]